MRKRYIVLLILFEVITIVAIFSTFHVRRQTLSESDRVLIEQQVSRLSLDQFLKVFHEKYGKQIIETNQNFVNITNRLNMLEQKKTLERNEIYQNLPSNYQIIVVNGENVLLNSRMNTLSRVGDTCPFRPNCLINILTVDYLQSSDGNYFINNKAVPYVQYNMEQSRQRMESLKND